MQMAKENDRIIRSRHEQNVTVECLKCGHIGVLTPDALSRFSMRPHTPIAAFVKRLRPLGSYGSVELRQATSFEQIETTLDLA